MTADTPPAIIQPAPPAPNSEKEFVITGNGQSNERIFICDYGGRVFKPCRDQKTGK